MYILKKIFLLSNLLVFFLVNSYSYEAWPGNESDDSQIQLDIFIDELTRIYNQAVEDRAASPDVLEDIRILLYGNNKIPRDGLIAEYLFEGNTKDTSITKNDGKIVGNARFVNGKIGKSLSVNYTGDYVIVPNNPNYSFINSSYSISLWIKVKDWNKEWGGWIISNLKAFDNNNGWSIYIRGNKNSNSGSLVFNSYTSGSIKSNKDITNNKWTHLVIIGDRITKEQTIYINGSLQAKEQLVTFNPTKHPLVFGYHYGIGDREIDGEIDQIRMYNKALTVKEVDALYNEH